MKFLCKSPWNIVYLFALNKLKTKTKKKESWQIVSHEISILKLFTPFLFLNLVFVIMRTFLIIFGLGICFLTHRCQLTVNTPPYSQNELDLLLFQNIQIKTFYIILNLGLISWYSVLLYVWCVCVWQWNCIQGVLIVSRNGTTISWHSMKRGVPCQAFRFRFWLEICVQTF